MVQFSTRACCLIAVISLKLIGLMFQNKIDQQRLPLKIKEIQRRVEHTEEWWGVHIAHFTAIKALLRQKLVSGTWVLL